MMVQYSVDYIDLPLVTDEREDLAITAGKECVPGVQDIGDAVRVAFNAEEQMQTANLWKPRVGNLDELKIAFATWLQENNKEALQCIVETMFAKKGYDILWAPPYLPDLQPIKKFWAAGKNHAAIHYVQGQKMSQTVELLCEGWYGTIDKYPVGYPRRKCRVSV